MYVNALLLDSNEKSSCVNKSVQLRMNSARDLVLHVIIVIGVKIVDESGICWKSRTHIHPQQHMSFAISSARGSMSRWKDIAANGVDPHQPYIQPQVGGTDLRTRETTLRNAKKHKKNPQNIEERKKNLCELLRWPFTKVSGSFPERFLVPCL